MSTKRAERAPIEVVGAEPQVRIADPTPVGHAPRLETERLILRQGEKRDFAAYAAQMTDAEAVRFIGGVTDARSSWRFFLVGIGNWAVTGSGWWMMEEKATGRVVGTVGAFFRENRLEPGSDLEIGWNVYREYWRRGFATEGARAALAWSMAHHDPPRVVAYVDEANTPSAGVARAIGMEPAGKTLFYGEPSLIYVVNRRPRAT